MPVVALACRLAAWFVLGAGLAGALWFLRYDGLGPAVAAFLVVQSLTFGVILWAVGRVAAETARLSRRLAPTPREATAWWRRTPRPAMTSSPESADPGPPGQAAREMTPDELNDFFGRPESLAAHRAAQRRG